MKKTLSLLLLTGAFLLCQAATVVRWDYNKPGASLQGVQTSPKVKNTIHDGALVLTVTGTDQSAPVHSIMVGFNVEKNWVVNKNYRVTVEMKADREATFPANVQIIKPPFSILKGGNANWTVGTSYQKYELIFTPEKADSGKTRVPNFLLGHVPEGTKLFVRSVVVEENIDHIPLAVTPQWKLIKDKTAPDAIPQGTEDIALVNETVQREGMAFKQCITLYQEFDSPADGFMQIGLSADYFMECFINGKSFFSTMERGNGTEQYRPTDHVVNFDVKKGKNLLCVQVYAGSRGWCFVAGPVAFQKSEDDSVLCFQISPEYRPLKFPMLVKKGTALDFSEINGHRKSIAEAGRVIINKEGHFALASDPDTPVRFSAFGWIPNNWMERADKWSHEQIDTFAEAVALQGYNMIRIHMPEGFLIGWKIHDRPFRSLEELGIPQSVEEIPFDMSNVDRFDYLIYALKKNNVYVNIDVMGPGKGYTLARTGNTKFSEELFFDQKFRKHWQVAVRFLLDRENPYTKTKLKDDPVLAVLDFMNEQDHALLNPEFYKRLLPEAREWFAQKGKTLPENFSFDETTMRGNDETALLAKEFVTEKILEMTSFYYNDVRALGYPGVINHWDMLIKGLITVPRAKLPAIAQHIYHTHPWEPDKPQKTDRKLRLKFWWFNQQDFRTHTESSLNSTFYRTAAVSRFLDRPFMITEYSHSTFNPTRIERGLLFGAYAAFQGWDCLTTFGHMVKLIEDPLMNFDANADPASRASDAIVTFAFLRGDVKEAPHSVNFALTPKNQLINCESAIGDDYAKLATLTKVGITCPDVTPFEPAASVKADWTLMPANYSKVFTGSLWNSTAASDVGDTPKLIQGLRQRGILPASNKTNFIKQLFESETGEILLDSKNLTMQVSTPRLEAVTTTGKDPFYLRNFALDHASVPACVAVAALDKSKTLTNTGKTLLIISTNAYNNGIEVKTSDIGWVTFPGDLPVIMRSGLFKLRLRHEDNVTPKIWALNLDGTRAQEIPGTMKNGTLSLTIDTSRLEYGTPFFEIDWQNQ